MLMCDVVHFQDDSGQDDQLWRELTTERVAAAVDAAQTALSIMTAPNMPKQVYLEDVIERTVMMAKTQLFNTIFPEFDPVYRIDPKNKRKFHAFGSIILVLNSEFGPIYCLPLIIYILAWDYVWGLNREPCFFNYRIFPNKGAGCVGKPIGGALIK